MPALSRLRAALLGLSLSPCCAPDPADIEPPPAPPAPLPEPIAVPEPPPSAPAAPAVPESEPEPTPAVDLTTATALRVKIVAIPNRKSWRPCGVIHSVGALEVEVQGAGEPPPRILLLVSCPVDGGRRRAALVVGAVLDVTLHARKQPWPSVHGLPELPRRYVKSIAEPAASAHD